MGLGEEMKNILLPSSEIILGEGEGTTCEKKVRI